FELLARFEDWPGQVVMYTVEGLPVSQKDIARVAMIFEAYDVNLEGETSFCVRAQSAQGTLDVWGNEESHPGDTRVRLQLPGAHNVQNALAALTAATVLRIDADTVVKTLEDFTGIRLRFEIRNQGPIQVNGQPMDVILVDDYAHHPTAISATLEAAHRRYPGRRLVAVYQPHMFSRTKTFFEQFSHAFDLAGVVIIADIFPARERDTGLISARELVEAMARQPHFQHGGQVLHGGSVQATTQLLRSLLRPNDLLLVMGAGDIYTLTDMVLEDRPLGEGK
ncbi:MAG: glutamate ligase domain-containing protein, partial [Ktedonobacteraceae bacterium]